MSASMTWWIGGPLPYKEASSTQGVVVSHQTRLGRVSLDNFKGYKLTDASLASMRAKGLPETVLLELDPLKG